MTGQESASFHSYGDRYVAMIRSNNGRPNLQLQEEQIDGSQASSLSVSFSPHFHPFVQELMERLVNDSIAGLQDADTAPARNPDGSPVTFPDGTPKPALYRELFTTNEYAPSSLVTKPYPVADLDFGPPGTATDGAYAVYNWELFFHIPVAIATHLSQNGRYEAAQCWFHYVFDPTDNSGGDTPQRYWKTKPFRTTDVQSIETVLTNLSSKADPQLREATLLALQDWQQSPFRPHLVARHRPSEYMLWTVMAYLDNLIAWGDALFAQDSAESVAEATQIYVLAANILGNRPQQVPAKGSLLPQTYSSLRSRLDDMSNALVRLETAIPFDGAPAPAAAGGAGARQLTGLGQTLYFCVPRNEALLGYWDAVADRLFKIHNSLSLQGAFRQLPAFAAPIDPAVLARAAAAGIDVAAVVSGANQPPPLARFGVLLGRASELCQEVKSLGAALLSAIEKQDGEALAALRARHETAVLTLAETVKYSQHQEAVKNREALQTSLELAQARYTYYERLLGSEQNQITFEPLGALDEAGLEKGQFTASEPVVGTRAVEVNIDVSASTPGGGPAGGKKISSHEATELDLLAVAQLVQDIGAGAEAVAAFLHLIPTFAGDVKPFGIGLGTSFGGANIAGAVSSIAAVHRGVAGRLTYEAGNAAKMGSYARREQEWQFQSNTAAGDITQLNKQIRAAQIREFMAKRELDNHCKQITQAEDIEKFLAGEKPNGKTTTIAYYALLRRETRGLYNQCYELALDTARKAERALRNELGDPSLTFVRPSYLAGPEGLLAGEKLHFDVRRMDLAHLDLNRREYELTQRVSLLQVAPWALVELRATGRCTFTIPEEFYDLSHRGHYFRRLRTVAVSIPCVAGEYTGVACTARLLRSRIRTSPLLGDDGYASNPDGDDRFTELLGTTEAIVTSSGVNDTGLFEGEARDDRLAPFEFKGAVGEWSLELPTNPSPISLTTIADVVMQVRYTARDGGEPLRLAAGEHLRTLIGQAAAAGSTRLLSVRHEFPTAWASLMASKPGDGTPDHPRAALKIELRREHYPFFASPMALDRIDLIARPKGPNETTDIRVADRALNKSGEPTHTVQLKAREELGGLLIGSLPRPSSTGDPGWPALPAPLGALALYFDDNALDDLVVMLRWRGKPSTGND